jgi:hypothetical protein
MRLPFSRGLWLRFPVGSVEHKVFHGIYPYPHYAYGVYWAAFNARQLGIERISAIEFGVAGGRGLVALERASVEIESALGVGIDVVGFDSGTGMPRPIDYRDSPHVWRQGFFPWTRRNCEVVSSARRWCSATSARQWLAWVAAPHSPVGFVSFDLDYYSSTKAAFRIFESSAVGYLPRVYCYFDDVASNNLSLVNEYVGELLAILEYNDEHAHRKLTKIEQLREARPRWESWQDRMFAHHDFEHPLYTMQVVPDVGTNVALPL